VKGRLIIGRALTELASNKLDLVLTKTNRNFQWDPEKANRGGRVIEILSEHTLQV
jgi:xylulose-5-phosphate/fructose-6-phosphate phosphoketolase